VDNVGRIERLRGHARNLYPSTMAMHWHQAPVISKPIWFRLRTRPL